uniref:DUF5663 domain-containing protein n=1 Tax=Nocardia amamiensis TaxID=404578 RepID=UPI000AB927B5
MDQPLFFPRSWLEEKFSKWIERDAKNRVLVVTGPPGTGKSSVLHGWADRLENDDRDDIFLAVAIIRDPNPNNRRMDDFAFHTVRNGLAKVSSLASDSTTPHSSGNRRDLPPVHVQMDVGAIHGGQVIGQAIADIAMRTPAQEVREDLVPRLRNLPAGNSIVVIIDGLDEISRADAQDFADAITALAQSVHNAPNENSGLGRLRLLLAGQPELPARLRDLRPETIGLSNPPEADEVELQNYVGHLLSPVTKGTANIEALAREIAHKAEGVWVWAYYVSRLIVKDVAEGRPVPANISTAPGLPNVYRDAMSRLEHRLPVATRADVYALLGLAAAAHDIQARLPLGVASEVMGIPAGELSTLVNHLSAVMTSDGAELQFYHGDFANWVIRGGIDAVRIEDAHEKLAEVLARLGGKSWLYNGPYVPNNALPHAIAAAEYCAGGIGFGDRARRCLELLADRERLMRDGRFPWIQHLISVEELCATDLTIPGTETRIGGLAKKLQGDLTSTVGEALATPLKESQLDEFERLLDDGDDERISRWMITNIPNYRDVAVRETRALALKVLEGWTPSERHGEFHASLARSLRSRAKRGGPGALLDLAEAVAAAQRTVDATPAEDES